MLRNNLYVIAGGAVEDALCCRMAGKEIHPILVTLARRLKALREARHLTLMEVLDVTNVNVGRVESNRQNVTVKTLVTLTAHYHVTLGELFEGIEEEAEEKDSA
ncbi:helix-turn-helix domain-containing protein [Hymenobacter ruber]